MYAGLFIVQANPPYSAPADPSVTAQRDASDNVVLNWIADENARGYSVECSSSLGGSYTAIVEHLTSTSFVDSSVRGKAAFYKVRAVNGEGVGISSIVVVLPNPTSSPTSPIPTKAPTPMPTPSPAIFICVKSNVVCPQNPQNCCSGSCRKGKCR